MRRARWLVLSAVLVTACLGWLGWLLWGAAGVTGAIVVAVVLGKFLGDALRRGPGGDNP